MLDETTKYQRNTPKKKSSNDVDDSDPSYVLRKAVFVRVFDGVLNLIAGLFSNL